MRAGSRCVLVVVAQKKEAHMTSPIGSFRTKAETWHSGRLHLEKRGELVDVERKQEITPSS